MTDGVGGWRKRVGSDWESGVKKILFIEHNASAEEITQ